jgi:hypothetical protein
MAQRKLTEQEMNYNFARTSLVWRNITKISGSVVRYGCVFGCVYFFFDAVKTFSGQETSANILLEIMAGMKLDKWIGYVFGIGCFIYGAIRNIQLRKTRKAFSEHIINLEKNIDQNRQKSRLNQYGETHDDDK